MSIGISPAPLPPSPCPSNSPILRCVTREMRRSHRSRSSRPRLTRPPHPPEIDKRAEISDERPSTADKTPSRRALSMVKRAFGNRRYSESFVSPFATLPRGARALAITLTPKQSKLYPFWRPRGFWDDLEVDDEDIQDEFLERGRSELLEKNGFHGRRMSLPLLDGQGAMNHSHFARSTQSSKPASVASHNSRVRTIPGLGVRFQYVGWKGIQRRFGEAKASRAERAKARERNAIKRSISVPTAIEPDDI